VRVGPQPRASRRRRQVVEAPPEAEEEEEELWEEWPQAEVDSAPRRTRQRGRSQRQAARVMRREQEDMGIDEDEAVALALAASLADDGGGADAPVPAGAAEDRSQPETAAASTRRAGRTRRRRAPAAGGGASGDSAAATGTETSTGIAGGARRTAPRGNRKRIVHVDPITGQRIRARRFATFNAVSAATIDAAEPEQPAGAGSETEEESDSGSPGDAGEIAAAEQQQQQEEREQLLAERLNRNLAAPVVAPSPLRPLGQRASAAAAGCADSPASPDLLASSPVPTDTASTDASPSFIMIDSDREDENEDGDETNSFVQDDDDSLSCDSSMSSALDTSAGPGDLMSRLQKRMRAGCGAGGAAASTTARQQAAAGGLWEREANR
jgi:hypothetical protein